MLIMKRKTRQSITIEPIDGIDLSQTLNDLFANGAIEIQMLEVGGSQVKVAIEAPPQLKIWRGKRPLAGTPQLTDEDAA